MSDIDFINGKIQRFFEDNPDIVIYHIIRYIIERNAIIGVGLVSLEQHIHNCIWDGEIGIKLGEIMPAVTKAITDKVNELRDKERKDMIDRLERCNHILEEVAYQESGLTIADVEPNVMESTYSFEQCLIEVNRNLEFISELKPNDGKEVPNEV